MSAVTDSDDKCGEGNTNRPSSCLAGGAGASWRAMVFLTRWFTRLDQAARTRLLLIGSVVGALIALGISVLVTSSPEEGERPQVRKTTVFDAPASSCLTWDSESGRDMRRIPCTKPHMFEVTEVRSVAQDFPRGAPAPDLNAWQKIATESCTPGAIKYLGRPLDPHGKLQVSALKPSESDWEAGNRDLRCGLWWTSLGGKLQPITGRAEVMNQSMVWPKGTCLALVGKTVGDPIDCAKPHAYEMIAVVDLSEEFGESYPSQEKQKAWLDKTCSGLADKYTGKLNLAKKKLILAWDTRLPVSWKAGSYKVNCMVGAKLPDGSGLAPVTGSIKKPAKPAGG